MKIRDWLRTVFSTETYTETITEQVGNVRSTRQTTIRVPRKSNMDEIDRLLAAAKGVKLDTEIIMPARAVQAEGPETHVQMQCADCQILCSTVVSTKWLTSNKADDKFEWQCGACGLSQYASIKPQ